MFLFFKNKHLRPYLEEGRINITTSQAKISPLFRPQAITQKHKNTFIHTPNTPKNNSPQSGKISDNFLIGKTVLERIHIRCDANYGTGMVVQRKTKLHEAYEPADSLVTIFNKQKCF